MRKTQTPAAFLLEHLFFIHLLNISQYTRAHVQNNVLQKSTFMVKICTWGPTTDYVYMGTVEELESRRLTAVCVLSVSVAVFLCVCFFSICMKTRPMTDLKRSICQ